MFILNAKEFAASVLVLLGVNVLFVYANDDLPLPEQRVMEFRTVYLSNYVDILPNCHANLTRILEGISAVPFDASVHALDAFVDRELAHLLAIAQSLDLGRSLSLGHAFCVAHDIYQPQFASSEYLNGLCNDFNEQDKLLFSRLVTLAKDLEEKWEIDDGIAWFATLEDNKTTGGGCLPGRRNRLFIALASIMANIGV